MPGRAALDLSGRPRQSYRRPHRPRAVPRPCRSRAPDRTVNQGPGGQLRTGRSDRPPAAEQVMTLTPTIFSAGRADLVPVARAGQREDLTRENTDPDFFKWRLTTRVGHIGQDSLPRVWLYDVG